jgi:DNA mismatch repair protein MutL
VALLPDSVARRIAAGEVIERPASVVRELFDNSIDAGATAVTVEIEGGGLERISVDDDGFGMSREDLELCWKPHATSKIATAEDLSRCRTLGFRGEALSSIAAVSRLEIRSRARGEEEGLRLSVSNNRLEALEAAPSSEGTTVSVQGLFYNLPARKRFLKRPQSEGQQVRKVLLEKALPEPEVRFRLVADGKERLLLPSGTLEERASALFGGKVPPQALHRLEGSGEGFRITLLVADPSYVRRDRKQIQPFVNGRRLKEFALVQAVEYAFTDVMHGGLFPYAVLLVEVEPELVDFNIHPAKQEARFRNLQEIHHRVVEVVRSFLRNYERKRLWAYDNPELQDLSGEGEAEDIPGPGRGEGALRPGAGGTQHAPRPGPGGGQARPSLGPGSYSRSGGEARDESGNMGPGGSGGAPRARGAGAPSSGSPKAPFDLEEVRRRFGLGSGGTPPRQEAREEGPSPTGGNRGSPGERVGPSWAPGGDAAEPAGEAGRITYFGQLFNLFLLVSRGRSLYIIDQHASHERLLYDTFRKNRAVQQLLVPITFEANEDESAALRRNREEYRGIGIDLEEREPGSWEIRALPQAFREESESLVETILELRGLQEELDRRFTAELACKAAVKRGDILDEISGEELAKRVLELQDPRCPHGRPLWFALTESELLRLIGRA